MQYTCLDIQKKVLEKLQGDPTLSSYVKQFGIGEENISRKFFPYVTVASVTEEVEPLCFGVGAPDLHRYRITILGGTNSLLPEVARAGNNSGVKGVVHLMDDIISAIYPGTIDGVFKNTLHLEKASYTTAEKSAGRTWIAGIIFRGIRKF